MAMITNRPKTIMLPMMMRLAEEIGIMVEPAQVADVVDVVLDEEAAAPGLVYEAAEPVAWVVPKVVVEEVEPVWVVPGVVVEEVEAGITELLEDVDGVVVSVT